MPVPEKTVEPVCRDEKGLQPRKLRRAYCKWSLRCAEPESPNGLFLNKFERHFAARTVIAAQTPICILNSFSQPKRISAARRYVYQRSCSARPQGLLPGKHAMCAPEKSEGPVGRDAIELQPRKHPKDCSRGGMRCARKDRRAGWQGHTRIAVPQTPPGLLSGKHAMRKPEKTVGPVCRDENGLRACCQESIRPAAPESPDGLFSNNFERHFAAITRIAAQTPIRCRLQVYSPNANLPTQCIFAPQTHVSCPNARYQRCCSAKTAGPAAREACDARARKDRRAGWQERNRVAYPQTPQGRLPGKHVMPVPEKTEGPVSRDAKELRPRTHRRSCCRGSMR